MATAISTSIDTTTARRVAALGPRAADWPTRRAPGQAGAVAERGRTATTRHVAICLVADSTSSIAREHHCTVCTVSILSEAILQQRLLQRSEIGRTGRESGRQPGTVGNQVCPPVEQSINQPPPEIHRQESSAGLSFPPNKDKDKHRAQRSTVLPRQLSCPGHPSAAPSVRPPPA
ncbi:hypothetical protein ANO11243_046680 [Dothideomycetidae sp. 11243]|nr:hypothetical protein ANO11243_046680 [fungal sp. No.11243]